MMKDCLKEIFFARRPTQMRPFNVTLPNIPSPPTKNDLNMLDLRPRPTIRTPGLRRPSLSISKTTRKKPQNCHLKTFRWERPWEKASSEL